MVVKKTKKISIIILCILILLLSGCGTKKDKNENKISVVASNFSLYDFSRAVCKDSCSVQMLVRPGAEMHGYEPSLSDIKKIRNADVFIYCGGESDVWIENILKSVDVKNKVIIKAMSVKGITLYEEESTFFGDENEDEGENHYDEHIWTSLKNASLITEKICTSLSDIDSENKSIYQKNASEYIKKINKLQSGFEKLSREKKNILAVADRFPLLYLAKDYDIEYIAAFSGCSSESDAGPKKIAKMSDEIKKQNIKTVFYIELSNMKMADAVCEYTGTTKRLLHSCQQISLSDFESGKTYVEIMEENLSALKEALL